MTEKEEKREDVRGESEKKVKPQRREAEGEEKKRGEACRGFENSGKESRKMTGEKGEMRNEKCSLVKIKFKTYQTKFSEHWVNRQRLFTVNFTLDI